MEFKEKAPFLNDEEFGDYYKLLADVHIQRATDLNRKCVDEILGSIVGEAVLDVGCGRGYLAEKIAVEHGKDVVGVDIIIPDALKKGRVKYIEGNIESIPFDDGHFDTVICTHTLEHVQDIGCAVKELRRVTRKRLIIAVPRQREYKYTFDLHLHFFPYTFSLLKIMKNPKATCVCLDNDIFYMEDLPSVTGIENR